MGRYPRQVRDAKVKCIDCNAPVAETLHGRYVCVDCGEQPLSSHETRDDETNSVGTTDDAVTPESEASVK